MSDGGGRRFSLRGVLVVCFVLVGALGIAFPSIAHYSWLTRDFLREQIEEDVTLTRAVAAGLERYLRVRAQLIGALAEEIAARGLRDLPALFREIDAARRRDPEFGALVVTDREGLGLVASPALDAEGRPSAGTRYDGRRWFQQALKVPYQPVYEIVVGRVLRQPTISVVAPIRSESGRVLGVVVGGLNLAQLRASLRVLDPDRSDRLVVVDPAGRVIFHSSAAWEAEARELSAEAVFQAAQRQGEGTTEYQSTFTGTRRRAAYVRMPSTGWVVWASRGPEFLAPRTRKVVRDTVVLGLAGVLVAAVAAVFVSGFLSRPLGALADATRQVSTRRLASPELLSRRSSRVAEFDVLLRGFAEMAEALRVQWDGLEAKVAERTQALAAGEREARQAAARLRVQEQIQRAYGELAALLNTLDRSRILQQAATRIAAALQAPLVAIYLSDAGPERLRLKAYAAVDDWGLDTALLSPAGLPAEVAARGEPVVLTLAGGPGSLRLGTGVGLIDVAAVAGWPLTDQSRVAGVLAVGLIEPLAEHTRSFLESAARQLSVALANATLYESVRFQSQETERLNAELRRASEVKSQFLASMSHELRTPMHSIIGFTDLLLASGRDPLSERQRTALEKVRDSGRHLLALINDVLDVSRIEAGRVEMRPQPFALGELVRECLDGLELEARARGLDLRATGLEGAPELVHDRARVKQILLNLLSNALKFTPAGLVEARVEPGADGTVGVAVADTGIGIAVEHHEAIFEPFQRVDSAEARAAGGTGLGLAISRRLARLAGGTLEVASTAGRGSVFTLRLPVRCPGQGGTGESEPATGADPPGGPGPRILVIDDDPNAIELIREALAGEPVRVEWAATAAAALTRVKARRPGLVLLDVMLQGQQDGWDVLDALKTEPATRDIPVVVHSVIDNPRRAQQLGADGVLVKPAPGAAVKALVSRLLGGGGTAIGR